MKSLGNVFIIGDSYSTFEGYIPEGYAVYYTYGEDDGVSVVKPEQTWWGLLIAETGSHLLRNCSYSGSTVCNTGYGGTDCRDTSFIGRFDALDRKGFFEKNKVDTMLIFGGTNDSWAEAPKGEIKLSDITEEDKYNALQAFCYLINRSKETLPDSRIICIINTELDEIITEGYKKVCEKTGTEYIVLHDIEKIEGHPDRNGMRQIASQIEKSVR